MENDVKQPDEQLVHAELVKLAADMPIILTVIVVDTIYGMPAAVFSRKDSFNMIDLDQMITQICDWFRLAIKVVDDFSLGEFKYFTSIGAEKTGILVPLTVDFGLVLVIQSGMRLDTFFAAIKPYCESLLKYLSD
jgi:hypothetical protein